MTIARYDASRKEEILRLSIRAWQPVFPRMRAEVPGYVYDAFYPRGWQERQRADISALLDAEGDLVWVALWQGRTAGFVGLRIHPEDSMGEINVLAVDPACQRRGIGRRLVDFALEQLREAGLQIAMVETVGDSGHEPARRTYRRAGFAPWPVARYFRRL